MVRVPRLDFLLFPPACRACGRPLAPRDRGEPGFPHLCAACHAALAWRDPAGCCESCGQPTAEPGRRRCPACPSEPPPWRRVAAPFGYEEPVRSWIIALKYHRHDPLAPMLGTLLSATIRAAGLLEGVDWVAPVPLHPSRIRQRGFSQSHLLAHHALAALRRDGLDAPPLRTDLLRRHRRTRPQVELPPAERHANVADAFSVPEPGGAVWRALRDLGLGHERRGAVPREAIAASHILLVDDVMTSGATLAACARALMAAGARRVDALVLARA